MKKAQFIQVSTGKNQGGGDRAPTDRQEEASKIIAVRGKVWMKLWRASLSLRIVEGGCGRRADEAGELCADSTMKNKTNKSSMQWLIRTLMCVNQGASRCFKAETSGDWICILENFPQVPWKPEVNVQFSKEDNEPGSACRTCVLGSLSSVRFSRIRVISVL